MAIRKAAVVGAGNMGSGIAQKIATEGFSVLLADTSLEAAQRGVERIAKLLEEAVERKIFKPEQAKAILGRLEPTGNLQDLHDADIVVEAVFEDLNVKQDLFKRLGEMTSPETILATNTSSFLVEQVASGVHAPERVIGLHYFYHPAKNRLVEVIGHGGSSPSVLASAWGFQERIGKTPIISADAPGFVVNRFFVPWLNEAIRLLEEGLSIASIEAAAKIAFGVGMGPFELMNVTGVPITLHASRSLADSLGEFYAPAMSLEPQVALDANWDLSGEPDEATFTVIQERLMGIVFTIAGQLVDEEVSSAEDTDIGARVGLRWPVGPFELANRVGIERAKQMVRGIVEKYGLTYPRSFDRTGDFVLSRVALKVADEVATLTINRPDKLNALDPETVAHLEKRFSEVSIRDDVKAIVLAGAGKAFVAGADVQFFVDKIRGNALDDIQAFTERGQKLFRAIELSEKPVVCAMDGLALGGGAELALACHAIVATTRSSMAFPETGIGIYPGLGGTQRLTRRLGIGLARYYLYTGAMFSSRDLGQLQLAAQVVEPEALEDGISSVLNQGISQQSLDPQTLENNMAALANWLEQTPIAELLSESHAAPELAVQLKVPKKMSFKAPMALRMVEELTQIAASEPLEAGLAAELSRLKTIFSSADALEGLSALLERRRPSYRDC